MKSVFAFFFLFQFMCSFGQTTDAFRQMGNMERFKKNLAESANKTETIQAQFVQEKHLSVLKEKLISEGTLLFKKPNLIKWAYNKPFDYVVVLNEMQATIIDDGRVTSMDLSASNTFGELNAMITNMVSGNVLDEKRFDIVYKESETQFLLKLTPRAAQMKKHIVHIEMYLNKADYSVDSIRLQESAADFTLIFFSNKKLNAAISESAFKIP